MSILYWRIISLPFFLGIVLEETWSEISPNQRIIARFSFFVVACLYENLPLVDMKKGSTGRLPWVLFHVSNLFLDWWRCKTHQIGEEKCFPNDSYFGLRMKLAIHGSRFIYIFTYTMYIHTIDLYMDFLIHIDCTHLATPLWCRCSCFDLSWKHLRRFAASKRFFVWTAGTGITSDLESLPRKFPVAGGACIAGRLRSFFCQRWGAGYLKFCELPSHVASHQQSV